MRPQHTNPEEAVRIHGDVRAMRSVACHLATFRSAAACRLLLPPAAASCGVAFLLFIWPVDTHLSCCSICCNISAVPCFNQAPCASLHYPVYCLLVRARAPAVPAA